MALEYRRAEGAEWRVRRDHLGQRAAGEQQFPRRIPLAVGARQRQIREPGLLTRPQVRGCDEAQHRVGDGPRIVRVVGVRDGCAHGRVGEDAPRRCLGRTQPGKQRVHRAGVHDAEAEQRQLPGVIETRARASAARAGPAPAARRPAAPAARQARPDLRAASASYSRRHQAGSRSSEASMSASSASRSRRTPSTA